MKRLCVSLFSFCLACSTQPKDATKGTSEPMPKASLPTPFPKMKAPQHPQKNHVMSLHGDQRIDPYFWMKERDSKPVLKSLTDENKYYESMTEAWNPLKETVYKEMRARVKEDDSTPPYRRDNFWYYTRYEKNKEYPIYCRKKGDLSAKEEIILDVNVLAKNKKYTSVADVEPSPDHNWIAYSVDHVGRRFYDIHFKNLKTGKVSSKKILKTTGGTVWANDNNTVFYTQQNPETLRSEKAFRFDLKSGKTTELYYEKDEIFSVYLGKSQTGKYLFLATGSFDSSEYRYLSADDPTGEWKIFLPREKKHEYGLEDGGDGFYIETNWKAENFRLMKAPYGATDKSQWTEVIPEKKDALLSGVLVLKSKIVVRERTQGVAQLRVIDRKSNKSELVKFPDPAYIVNFGANENYETEDFRYSYTSLVRPASTFDYDFKTNRSVLIKQQEVPTYDSNNYVSERAWAKASDGTKIPISLVYKKGLKKDGTNPILIYGYGSYGYSMDASFRGSIISLLDRGFVYAIAHIRGGSEMGRYWYEQGRMENKKNTFSDFVSCTEALIEQKYASPQKVFAMGGSAGGLLMGAVTNLRPDLYRGIVSVVPFVDVLTTMLDPDIPLTTAEYEQWGNPNEKKAYDYIKSYSPYDQLKKNAYPSILVMTGYHDSQVQYWEPAKYVARARDLTTSGNPVLFKTDMNAGHSGASGRFQALKELSEQYTFILALAGDKN